jgi:hypothetical protein
MFACVNACRKTPLTIHFIYLGNKEMYWIFKACCITRQCFIFNKTPFISYVIFLYWKNMIFRHHAPKFKYPPQYFVIVYTTHHVSCHYLSQKCALIVVNKMRPTPAGRRLILSLQCWILPSDHYSLPSMPILRHSTSDSQSQVIQQHHHNLHFFLCFKTAVLTPHACEQQLCIF